MSKELKVYAGNYDGRFGRLVAASSKAEAARLIGVSMYRFNQFFCVTGNTQQIAVGMSKPGVVFGYPLSRFDPEYVEVVKK